MYVQTYREGPLGTERLTNVAVVGWLITYRAGHDPRHFYGRGPFKRRAPLRREQFTTPSRFGALRALVRECRLWCGRDFLLEIESAEPLHRLDYEPVDWIDC